jgi:hypothetical protein
MMCIGTAKHNSKDYKRNQAIWKEIETDSVLTKILDQKS